MTINRHQSYAQRDLKNKFNQASLLQCALRYFYLIMAKATQIWWEFKTKNLCGDLMNSIYTLLIKKRLAISEIKNLNIINQ